MPQIIPVSIEFDSVHNGEDKLFDGGPWANTAFDNALAQCRFEVPHRVRRITLEMAGSDVTSDGCVIYITLLNLHEGAKVPIPKAFILKGANINRGAKGTMSPDSALREGFRLERVWTGPLDLHVSDIVADSLFLTMYGHGLFAARDLKIFGEPVK